MDGFNKYPIEVSRNAVERRLRRKLRNSDIQLKLFRKGTRGWYSAGPYFVIHIYTNTVVSMNRHLEDLAEEYKVLREVRGNG